MTDSTSQGRFGTLAIAGLEAPPASTPRAAAAAVQPVQQGGQDPVPVSTTTVADATLFSGLGSAPMAAPVPTASTQPPQPAPPVQPTPPAPTVQSPTVSVAPTYTTPSQLVAGTLEPTQQGYQQAYVQPSYVQPGAQQVLMYSPQLVPPPPSKGKLLASLFGRGTRGKAALPTPPTPLVLSAPSMLTTIT